MKARLSETLPKASYASAPCIRAFPTLKAHGELVKKAPELGRLRSEREKHERQLALPVLTKYYRDKKNRKTKSPLSPVLNQLSSIQTKLDILLSNSPTSSAFPSPSNRNKLDCLEAESAFSCLIKKCDNRCTVSVKDQDNMRKIEQKVRRDTDRMKAFFRQKDKRLKYSDRRKYWVDEPVLTHSAVKSMMKSLRINTLKTKIYV